MGGKSQRLFFALDPDPGVRERFISLQTSLNVPARRVPPANLHMTLAFLGDVPVSALQNLCGLAANIKFSACEIQIDCAGAFPKSRVGWLGCTRPPASLTDFQARLADALIDGGFKPDNRSWKPHVTLYRDLRKPFETIPIDPVRWKPKSFCLMHSGQCRKGVIYTIVGRWPS